MKKIMKKPKNLAAAIIIPCAIISAGCSDERFPQYSGEYRLQKTQTVVCDFLPDEGFTCLQEEIFMKQNGPSQKISVENYISTSASHYLDIRFHPSTEGQKTEILQLSLHQALYGVDVDRMKKVYFNYSPFCNASISFNLSISTSEMIGSSDDFFKIYQPQEGISIYDNEKKERIDINEKTSDRWLSDVNDNDGMLLTFIITKYVSSYTDDCPELKQLITEKTRVLFLTYQLTNHDSSLENDMREDRMPSWYPSNNSKIQKEAEKTIKSFVNTTE